MKGICNGIVKTKVYKETMNRKGMYIINYYKGGLKK